MLRVNNGEREKEGPRVKLARVGLISNNLSYSYLRGMVYEMKRKRQREDI